MATTSIRPTTPPRHTIHLRGGDWNRDRIIEACQLWAAETGSPPRYIDWMPVHRSLDRSPNTTGAEKWEREQGRWPSTQIVFAHFPGRWRELLLASGFDSPPPITMPLQERIPYVLHLRNDERLTWAQIADVLGMKPDAVRKYGRARPCPADGCDQWVVKGTLCRDCACRGNSPWGRAWTREEVVDAMQLWVDRYGEPPGSDAWRPPYDPRWLAACPTFPPASAVIRLFEAEGGWNGALNAVGHDRPRPPILSDDEIARNLREHFAKHGESPRKSTWQGQPCWETIGIRFGSITAALKFARLPIRQVPRGTGLTLTEDELLEQVRQMSAELGRTVRVNDRVAELQGDYVSPSRIAVLLGVRWNEVLERAGLPRNRSGPRSRRAPLPVARS